MMDAFWTETAILTDGEAKQTFRNVRTSSSRRKGGELEERDEAELAASFLRTALGLETG